MGVVDLGHGHTCIFVDGFTEGAFFGGESCVAIRSSCQTFLEGGVGTNGWGGGTHDSYAAFQAGGDNWAGGVLFWGEGVVRVSGVTRVGYR